jgi:hypothetical protein
VARRDERPVTASSSQFNGGKQRRNIVRRQEVPRQAEDKLGGKPRALSRQTEADIKLEVHRDSKIRMHLQEDH